MSLEDCVRILVETWQRPSQVRLQDEDAQRAFVDAFQQLCDLGPQTEKTFLDRGLVMLADAVKAPDILNASEAANTCGMLVEWGADPGIAFRAVLERLSSQLVLARDLAETLADQEAGAIEPLTETLRAGSAPEASDQAQFDLWKKLGEPLLGRAGMPEDFRAWVGLRYVVCAAMTMLSKEKEARKTARLDAGLVENASRLSGTSQWAFYVSGLLDMVDDLELLVLHAEQQRGYRVRLEAVRNNFHLFTLLQGELLGNPEEGGIVGTEYPDPLTVALARGESQFADLSPEDLERAAWGSSAWTYYQWTGYLPDGSFAPVEDYEHRVLGELTPREILPFEESPVVILAPLRVPQSWDANFFAPLHPALRPKVRILEQLDTTEVRDTLARIRHTPRVQ